MTTSPPPPASSSSAAASSAAPPPTTSAPWARTRCCSSSATSSPPAPPGTPPASSASSAPTPTSPSSSATPSRLYDRLEAETGLATGWKMNGGLRLACTPERWTEVKRQATTARSFGLEMQLLTPKEAQDLWPLMQVDDVIGAAFLPTDGQASPSDLVQALARGARTAQASRSARTPPSPASASRTAASPASRPTEGPVACEKLVLCAGQWTRAARRPRRRQRPAGQRPAPVPRSPSGSTASPRASRPCATPTASPTTRRRSAASSWAATSPTRGPGPRTASPRTSPSSCSTTTGTTSSRSWSSPSAASRRSQTRRHQAVHQRPRELHPRRQLHPRRGARGRGPLRRRRLQRLRHRLAAAAPAWRSPNGWRTASRPTTSGRSTSAASAATTSRTALGPHPHARGLRQALHHGLAARGIRLRPPPPPLARSTTACRPRAPSSARSSAGSGRTGSPAPPTSPATSTRCSRPNWFDAVGREHRACREAAALFDQTSFAKFLLTGRDAEAALSWICAGDTSRPPGTLTYTQMLNARGGIECDLTVARLAEDAYYIVTGTGFATHDFDWIAPQHPAGRRRPPHRRHLRSTPSSR